MAAQLVGRYVISGPYKLMWADGELQVKFSSILLANMICLTIVLVVKQ